MKIIPVVVGALGTTLRLLPKRLKDIGIETRIVDLQKSAILLFCKDPKKIPSGLRRLVVTKPQGNISAKYISMY